MSDEYSKVLTLVFTDLADSTSLKSSHGDNAVDALLMRHREHVSGLAAECAGRIIDWAGDGCFLTFDTSSAGVLFALRLQQAHAEESDLPSVRIGIHLGEVTERPGPDGTVHIKGLAVDVTARIEGLAKPGQVLMSSSVYNSARQRMGVEAMGMPLLWQLHGTYELKGFDTPLDIGEAGIQGVTPLGAPKIGDKARLIRKASKQPTGEFKDPRRNRLPLWGMVVIVLLIGVIGILLARTLSETSNSSALGDSATRKITSIAVLPFKNLMGEEGKDYFVDGMTDTLTTELSKIGSIKVISRTSAMKFKGSKEPSSAIAQLLGVDGLVGGSIQKFDDGYRISAHLISGSNEAELWNDYFDGTLEGVMKLQGDVAIAIADQIGAVLTQKERDAYANVADVDPVAWDWYLQGLDAWRNRPDGKVDAAIEPLTHAIEVDPEFSEAIALLAMVYRIRGVYSVDSQDDNRESSRLAERAYALNPRSVYANLNLASFDFTHGYDWNRDARYIDRALEIDPNNSYSHVRKAIHYRYQGQLAKALESGHRAMELDPLSPVSSWEIIRTLYMKGDYEEAVHAGESARQEFPSYWQINYWFALALGEVGRTEDALALVAKARDPNVIEFDINEVLILAACNRIDELEVLLADIDYEFLGQRLIPVFVALERIDDAIRFVQELEHRSDAFSRNFLCAVKLKPLWSDDRFWESLERSGFPNFSNEHPGYEYQQTWLRKKAAEEALAAQPKQVRRFSINLDPRHPVAPAQYPGNTHDPLSFTPEGDAILYTAGVAGKVYLAERALESLETRVIEGTEGGRFPMVSPDGNRITFHADRSYWMMSLQSGISERLTDGGYVLSAIWENDSSLILSSPNPTFGLQRFDLSSREITPLTDSAKQTGVILDASISLWEDSRILFGIRSTGGTVDNLEVFALDLDEGSYHEVIKASTIPVYVRDGFLVFAQRGRLMASKFDEASMSLKGPMFDVTEPRMIRDNEAPQNFGISPEGTLAYVAVEPAEGTAENGLDIVWVDMEGKISNVDVPISISPNTVFTSVVKDELRIIVNSNDGNLYSLDPTGTYGLNRLTFDQESKFNYFGATDEEKGGILVDVEDAAGNWIERISWQDGSVSERILETQTDELGNFAAYHFDEATNTLIGGEMRGAIFKVASISLDGAMEIRRVGEPDEFSSDNPALSPDGHWLAYQAKRGETVEVYVTKFPSFEGTWQVSFEGGGQPLWAPDGSKIYYRGGTSVMAADVSLDNGFSVGTPSPLFPDEFFNGTIRRSYDLHPDGTRFLMLKARDASDVPATEIIVVENWFEVLKEKARAAGALD